MPICKFLPNDELRRRTARGASSAASVAPLIDRIQEERAESLRLTGGEERWSSAGLVRRYAWTKLLFSKR
jgi:hypothetical protein